MAAHGSIKAGLKLVDGLNPKSSSKVALMKRGCGSIKTGDILSYFLFILFCVNVWVFCLHVCMRTMVMTGFFGGKKRALSS